MASLNTEINTKIKEITNDLNRCIRYWYERYFPKSHKFNEFVGCSDNSEFAIIEECYYILRNNLVDYDTNVLLLGIIYYYYYTIVIEHNKLHYVYQKYLIAEVVHEDSQNENSKYVDTSNNVIDNVGNEYIAEMNSIQTESNGSQLVKLFADGKDTTNVLNLENGYIYYFSKYHKEFRRSPNIFRLTCFADTSIDNDTTIQNVNKIVTIITTNDSQWASQVRRLINNFNNSIFKGGFRKKPMKSTKKHKKTIIKTKKLRSKTRARRRK